MGELAERLGVSEVTIRKDLAELEAATLLQRTRGGAVLAQDFASPNTIGHRRGRAVSAKEAMARETAQLVGEGETVFLDAGSSCAAVARALQGRGVNIVTNSLEVLDTLAGEERAGVYSLGGRLRPEAGSFVGPATVATMEEMHFDLAILGTTGFSREGELSSQNHFESEVKRAALARATRRVVLADSGKLGTQAFSVFARCSDLDLLVTDAHPDDYPFLDGLGVEILTVHVEAEGNGSGRTERRKKEQR